MSAPKCRYCAKPIPKATHTHWFGALRPSVSSSSTEHVEKPKDKVEAQRLTNRKIVSLTYWPSDKGRYVARASSWDGETYKDDLFCRDPCARDYGRWAAREMDKSNLISVRV